MFIKQIRHLPRVSMAAAIVLLAVACGGGSEPEAAETPAPETAAEDDDQQADPEAPDEAPDEEGQETDNTSMSDEELLEAAEAEGSVLWYTAIPTEASEAVAAAFMEKYPSIQAEVLRLPSFQLWERFRTEKAARRNIADVISFSDWGVQQSAMEFGLLERYVPPGIEEVVPADRIEPLDGYGWSNRITTVGILYNTDAVPEEYAPSTWEDLLDPWWGEENRLAIGDPRESAAIYGAFWQMSKEPMLGPDYFRALGELDPPLYAQGGQQINAVTAGEHAGTIVVDYRGWQLIADGAPVAIVYPENGVGNTADFNSVVADAPNPNASRLFMNFLASFEGADALARSLGSYLSRSDSIAYPEGVGRPPITEVPLLPLDLDAAAAEYDEFNAEFDEWIGR